MSTHKHKKNISSVFKWLTIFIISIGLVTAIAYILLQYLNFDIVHRKGTTSSSVSTDTSSNSGILPLIEEGKIKNIILFVGDGMGLGQITATRYRYLGPNGRLNMERMPVTGLINTFAANSLITDSGAGATAMSTGFRTDIGMIGVNEHGTRKETILEILQAKGLSTGLVTSSDITDATPGAFASHVTSRKMKNAIVKQLIESKVNILVSGGETFHGKELEGEDRISVIQYALDRGYQVVNEKDEFLDSSENQILALFEGMASEKLGDSIYFNEEAPKLSTCTRKALELLSRDNDGFFLLVEEEGIDSGSHINRIDFVTSHLKNFDDAVAVGLDFAAINKETLVIVLSDHETGGLTLVKDNSTVDEIGVRWSTDGHTGQPVPVFAFGPGAINFMGIMDNKDIPVKIAELMQIDNFPDAGEK